MEIVFYPFMLLAGVGLGLSLFAHGASLLGVALPSEFMGLHLGIFVVWLPAIVAAYPVTRGVPRKDYWKAALLGCPPWMQYAVYGFFGYALLNFALFFLSSAGGASSTSTVRGFSGHWMVFYAGALALMYAALQRKKQGLMLQCSQGHPVSPSARFCETCGEAIPQGRKTRRARLARKAE